LKLVPIETPPPAGTFRLRTVDLKIEDIAFGGKGVARESGKAVFVPFTIDGERISAQIVREKKQFAEAELVDLQEISPHRVKSQCPYFGRCGGCAYQHIAYEHQLAIKWRQVRDVLQRIGKIKDVPMRPIITSPISYAYRNRITVHAQDGVIGFFQRDSHRLIDVERCPIAMDEANRALARLRASRVRDGHYTLRAESGPRVFSQTNDAVASAMRDLIAEIIPSNQELLIDAYCGAGFLAKALLAKFERVIGIDWDKFAIAAARENASAKETYVAGEIEEALTRLLRGTHAVEAAVSAAHSQGVRVRTRSTIPEKTTVIVDPPATGLTNGTCKTIVDVAPAKLIYVSCNPSTMARDLRELQRRFVLESVTPLDMFPQTAEIEVVAQLAAATHAADVTALKS
jgi:tRNA/tmRNA/rRNA uracil-C5-methylase (TrmA/RlmC/RlmD family)